MSTSYYNIPIVTVAPTESLRVYTGWELIDRDTQLASLAMLISRLRNTNLRGVGLAEAVVAVFTCAIPDMASQLTTMKAVTVSVVQVTPVTATGFTDLNHGASGELTNLFQVSPPDPDAASVTSTDGLYAAVASILMAFGKQAGVGPDAAIIKARPAALINRFSIPEADQGCLPGKEYGPGQADLGRIFDLMSTYSEIRMLVTQYFLGVASNVGHSSRVMEIMMTNFRLLRGTQLTHMGAIIKFMNMHPWSIRVPELSPYYQSFATELALFAKLPAAARDYHRMLAPQADYMFVSANYRPLIAVAGDFVKDVEAKFDGYIYNAINYVGLIAKVRTYEPAQAQFIGTNDLAVKLGLPDVTLPPTKTPSATTPIAPI